VLIVADTGPIISLSILDKLDLLETLYGDILIPEAVWDELNRYIEILHIPIANTYKNKVTKIATENNFTESIDKGESEALTLYQEIHADYLLIDDQGARNIAEANSIKCIGTLRVLCDAKEAHLITCLRSYFLTMLDNKRYYSRVLLNKILIENGEVEL
jgi:predicted nucleic acid-binding protein